MFLLNSQAQATCRNSNFLFEPKNQVQEVHTIRKLLTKYENQAQMVESQNQVQHEVTLYFENSQDVNQEGSKSPKHEIHFRNLHNSFGRHPIPFFGDGSGDDKKCRTRKKPKYYKVCFKDGHCLQC